MAKALQKKESNVGENAKFCLKTPKGTRDFGPKQMAIRESVINTITKIFKRHGAETIDTPVFELRDILMGKYGEESSKLVYELVDQGGEMCSLRYDLTVPFARYLAMNKLLNVKRYQIAKVYRRDQPVMTKGRYREFYQCDFDIAGQYDLMVPEAECLKISDEILAALDIGEYEIKLNHRILLEGMFAVSGIKPEDFKTVCSSVDKLDKQPWLVIEQELLKEKLIDEKAVKNLKSFVCLRETNPQADSFGLLNILEKHASSFPEQCEATNNCVSNAIKELRLLLDYTDVLGCTPGRVVFDPSLARGLDYYTGAIYEVVIKQFSFNAASSNSVLQNLDEAASGPIGSVAAGGRYDKLVGMFKSSGGKKKREDDVPCVGISFGIERLFTIAEMKATAKATPVKISPTDVFVTSPQKNMLRKRMELCTKLWAAGIRSEFTYKDKVKVLNEFQFCEDKQIPWLLILGEQELEQGCVKLRNIQTRQEEDVALNKITEVLKEKLRVEN